MSIDMMNRVGERDDIKGVQKNVAMALANYADEHGVCYPSLRRLMKWSGWGERACQAAISELCSKGLLRVLRRQDSSNVYQFVMDSWPMVERTRGAKERSLFDVMQAELPPAGDAPVPPHIMHPTPAYYAGPPAGDAPITVNEPSEEPTTGFFGDLKSPEPSLSEHIEQGWARLKERHPRIAGIRKMDDGMLHKAKLRAQQHAKDGQSPLQVWDELFEIIDRTPFLCGEVPPGQGRTAPFTLSIAWVLQAQKFQEIMNGKFPDNRSSGIGERRLGPTTKAALGAIEGIRHARERGRFGGSRPHDERD